MTTKTRRRQDGEGSVSEYQTKAGKRYLAKVRVQLADGTRKAILTRGFTTRKDAAAGCRALIAENEQPGGYQEPSKATVAEYLEVWSDGLRLAPSTVSSYRKNVRLHLVPHIGGVKLTGLTGPRLTALYRQLETSGRVDGTGGLSARTVRYVATIMHKALKDAVRAGLIQVNPADVADAPKAREARSPEMVTWDAAQASTFTRWALEHCDSEQVTGWRLLLATGMRRGELLALRWKDCDLDAGSVAVRRSATTIKNKGSRQQIVEGPTKTGHARVVDLDGGTVEMLRSYRKERAAAAFTLGAADALVMGDPEGAHRLPESFSRYFREQVDRCIRWQASQSGEGLGLVDVLPRLHLHGLRHSHATILLGAGVHPKIVQERLGHQTISITMDVYSHALPTMQRAAADLLGGLLGQVAQ